MQLLMLAVVHSSLSVVRTGRASKTNEAHHWCCYLPGKFVSHEQNYRNIGVEG